MINIGIFNLFATNKIPAYATEASSCFDIKASLVEGSIVTFYDKNNTKLYIEIEEYEELVLQPGERCLVPTNIIFDIPEGFSLRILSRSGLALKHGIIVLNSPGVVDQDYVDPTFVILMNTSSVPYTIKNNDSIAQGEFVAENPRVRFYSLEGRPLQKTSRSGGFGSTGR